MVILIPIYTIFIYISLILSFPKNTLINNKFYMYISFITLILFSIYIVYVTNIFYTDRIVYTRAFNLADRTDFGAVVQVIDQEPLFVILTKLISEIIDQEIYYYILLHFLFLSFLVYGLFKIKNIYLVVITILIYLNYIFYYGYVLNGIRQGIAFAALIFLLGLLLENKKSKGLLFSLVPILFHYSALPIVIIMFLIKYFNSYIQLKYLFIVYIFFSFLYIFNLQSLFVGFLNFEYLIEYSNENIIDSFGEVNNLNFLIFNTIFLFIFYYFYRRDKNDKIFLIMYKLYISFSLYFILFGYVAFSNRIASYSWLLIPVIIGLILEKDSNRIFILPILIFIILSGIVTGVPKFFIGV